MAKILTQNNIKEFSSEKPERELNFRQILDSYPAMEADIQAELGKTFCKEMKDRMRRFFSEDAPIS
ncbi:MAG: hypothetical protein HY265_06315 [Deltaproteobacteria bacterium]|nr:hypothetical protein [Deltaproteobacteria bacterium]